MAERGNDLVVLAEVFSIVFALAGDSTMTRFLATKLLTLLLAPIWDVTSMGIRSQGLDREPGRSLVRLTGGRLFASFARLCQLRTFPRAPVFPPTEPPCPERLTLL